MATAIATAHSSDNLATATAWAPISEISETCYVRAKFPFSSEESSSLSFRPGDFIRVLTKQESGWWDGLLDGHRGWFPSNYVEEIELVGSDDEELQQQNEFRHGPEDDVVVAGIEPEFVTSAEPGYTSTGKRHEEAAYWIPQSTGEGRVYYFNTRTGTTQWDVPFASLSDALSSATIAARQMPRTTGMRPPLDDSVSLPEAQQDPAFKKDLPDAVSKGKVVAAEWTDIDDIAELPETHMRPAGDTGEDNEILLFAMPDDHQSDPFDLPDLTNHKANTHNDSHSTDLQPANNQMSEVVYPVSNAIIYQEVSPYLVGEVERTLNPAVMQDWSSQISAAVSSLKSVVAAKQHNDYLAKVDTIRIVISHLGQSLRLTSAAQSSPSLTGDHHQEAPQLWQIQFRQILSALSKLTVVAHNAMTDWTDSDSTTDLVLKAALNLETLVLSFMLVVERGSAAIIGNTIVPALVANRPVGGGWHGNGVTGSDSEVMATISSVPFNAQSLTSIQTCGQSIHAGVRSCRTKISQYEAYPRAEHNSMVLRDVIEVVTRVREMLTLCERADLSALDPPASSDLKRSPTLHDFAVAKQSMYDAVADITLYAQSFSSSDTLEGTVSGVTAGSVDLSAYLGYLETALQALVLQAEFMLQELITRYSFEETYNFGPDSTLADGSVKSNKLRQILGDDASGHLDVGHSGNLSDRNSLGNSSHVGSTEHTPWFLDHELESDLTYDSKGNVKAGTLLALVERLTRHDHLDSMYNNTFLLTYKSFCSAQDLSALLVQRFMMKAPSGLSPEQEEIWIQQKQQPIRLRVFNVLKCWMEQFYQERNDESTIQWLDELKRFASETMTLHMAGAGVLVWMIEQRMLHGDEVLLKKMVMNNTVAAPPAIVPKNMKKIKLLELDPLEVARQLTIMESNLYNKIKPFECLDKSWSKPDAPGEAENIKAMILHSNQITAWVAEAILYQTDLKKRVSLIKHFVQIAEKCRLLNNFSTLTAIISGLNSAPIHRLRRTWALLHHRIVVAAEDLNKLMNSSKNFSQYREALHQEQPPCVPFLGVYLTDLTFIEDGNPNMSVKARHLINISKRMKTAEVIRDIQQYQTTPYSLTTVPEIQNYIKSCMEITRDISELYDISLEREPREREDEKIARLLQESGFL